jgi:hypothetical protein
VTEFIAVVVMCCAGAQCAQACKAVKYFQTRQNGHCCWQCRMEVIGQLCPCNLTCSQLSVPVSLPLLPMLMPIKSLNQVVTASSVCPGAGATHIPNLQKA